MALGFAIQGLAAAYAVIVAMDGGFYNEAIPASIPAHREIVAKEVASHQNLEALGQEAIERAGKDEPVPGFSNDFFWQTIHTQISLTLQNHRTLLEGNPVLPEGYIGDLSRFETEEWPTFPEKCQVGVDGVFPQSILYAPGREYELFCGANLTSAEVFTAYLAELNSRGWMVAFPVFSPESKIGFLESSDGEWKLQIIVAPSADPRKYRVTVIWVLTIL
jgi:hypothetical protein